MTWWQTLLIAVAPVLVTATALVRQHTVSARAAQRAAEFELLARRNETARDEARSAHLAASRPLALIWDSLWTYHRATMALRGHVAREILPPFAVPVPLFEEFTEAFDVAALACSKESVTALEKYGESLKRLGYALTSNATLEAAEAAIAKANEARIEYFRLARSNVDFTGLPLHAAPPARSRR